MSIVMICQMGGKQAVACAIAAGWSK